MNIFCKMISIIKTIFFCIIFTIFLFSEIGAQPVPTLEVILNNVHQATIPNKQYSVVITQVLDLSSTNSIANGNVNEQTKFIAKYIPEIGLKAQKIIESDNQDQGQNKSNDKSIEKKGNVRVIVNLDNFFKEANESHDIKIVSIDVNGQNYYKVSADYKLMNYIFFIDPVNFYVSKAILSLNNQIFAEVNISYKYSLNNYWLPDKLVINHYSDNSHITQIFDEYTFN